MKGFSRLSASAFSTISRGFEPTKATQMRGRRSGRCRGMVGRGVDMLLSAWSLQGEWLEAQAQSRVILCLDRHNPGSWRGRRAPSQKYLLKHGFRLYLY